MLLEVMLNYSFVTAHFLQMFFDISSEKNSIHKMWRKHTNIVMHVLLICVQRIYNQVNKTVERKTMNLKMLLNQDFGY